MWGNSAVGKLVKGADALRPSVEAFVDEEAGFDVIEKVRRRLQHFIDRKVAALFDPLLAMSRDEALTGLARGFAFRLVEHLGVLPRESVAAEVKELDQDARGALRKHGVRFGQYTIFQQALLKPAPTRLRLVLASLWDGLDIFPESPPPGLVTIPNLPDVPANHYTLAGYHPAGARAIRIDMLERLADILRGQDSRGGFEATPDMLSITGMTLEQFSDLMGGLGYKGEKAEREKAKAVVVAKPAPVAEVEASSNPIPEEASPLAEAAAEAEAEAVVPEMEVYYTFTWAPRPRGPRRDAGDRGNRPARAEGEGAGRARGDRPQGERPQGDRPQGDRPQGDRPQGERRGGGKPQGKPGGGKPQGDRPERSGERSGDRGGYKGGKPGAKPKRDDNTPRVFEARPPKSDKIDPDNPFAVLAALRDKK
jgi:ATP-dependent RNA helicase SUPV3L1/SUV3